MSTTLESLITTVECFIRMATVKKAKGDILVDVSFGVVPRQSLEFVFLADVRFSLFIPGIIMTKEMSKRSKKETSDVKNKILSCCGDKLKGAPNEMRKKCFLEITTYNCSIK